MSEIEQLKRDVADLRRRSSRTCVAVTLSSLFFGLIVGVLVPLSSTKAQIEKLGLDELKCRAIRVIGKNNKVVASITADGDHGGTLVIFNAKGDPTVALQPDDAGGKVIVLGSDGKSRIALRVGPDGGMVNVLGRDEKLRVQTYIATEGQGFVRTLDAKGNETNSLH